MANAKRDENNEAVGLAWDNTNSTTKSLLVDPVTGRLLIDVTLVAPYASTVHTGNKFDENNVPTASLTEDDASADAIPIHVDRNTNNLLIDLIVG